MYQILCLNYLLNLGFAYQFNGIISQPTDPSTQYMCVCVHVCVYVLICPWASGVGGICPLSGFCAYLNTP